MNLNDIITQWRNLKQIDSDLNNSFLSEETLNLSDKLIESLENTIADELRKRVFDYFKTHEELRIFDNFVLLNQDLEPRFGRQVHLDTRTLIYWLKYSDSFKEALNIK